MEVVPPHKLGHFSRENYGDRQVLGPNGVMKIEKRASALLPSVKKLSSKQWYEITAAAKQYAFESRTDSSPAVTPTNASDDEGFLLVQSDSDEDA
jgi:hypothetical protein